MQALQYAEFFAGVGNVEREVHIGMVSTRWPWISTMVQDLVDLIAGVPLPGQTPLIS